jgi:hypothetical protein
MRRTLTVAFLLVVIGTVVHAQGPTTRMFPGTSLPVPANLTPPDGEPIKCGLPVVNHYLGGFAEEGVEKIAGRASILERSERQTSVVSGGFRVHFDTTGLDAPALLDSTGSRISGTARAFVDSVFSILQHVLAVEISTLRYLAPPTDGSLGGGPEYDIYIMNLGDMYGVTYPDVYPADGGTSTSSITIDNDFAFVRPVKNRGLGGLRVTLAHEFHHAIQLGNYGYWSGDLYYYEITSTWMEDVVYPDVNDYYNYLGAYWGQFHNPDKPFNSFDSSIPYSRAIWGLYVAKRFGIDVMRESWEAIRQARPHIAIDQVLRAHGSTMNEAYSEWALWNYFTGSRAKPSLYYTDGADYPLMIQSAVEFTGSSRDVVNSLKSLASTYMLVERGTDSMTVVLSNVDLSGLNAATNPLLPYTFRLRSTQGDDTYKRTPLGVYAKLDVSDLAQWSTWYAIRDTVSPYVDPSSLSSEHPFPSPFRPGRNTCVYIPLPGTEQVQGSMYVFSSSFELVREFPSCSSVVHLGRQMFSWDGRMNDGSVAPTGIYVFVIDIPSGKIKGKIPLVRE